jgi:hypothetical protein
MLFKRFSVLIAAFFTLLCSAASAAIITFQFNGTVTYGTGLSVPVGTPVVGTFVYDTSAVPNIQYHGYANYQLSAPSVMTLSVGPHTVTTNAMTVSIWNHYKGNVEDMVHQFSSGMVLNGTTFDQGTFGFSLGSSPRNNRPLNSTKLPTSYDVSMFTAPGLTYGALQTDGGPNGTLLQFSLDSIVVTQTTP